MKLIFRRIVYIFFIIIFLVVAPLTIFYTMGYRYNLEKGRVQKTGVMKITTVPRDADIYLNGEKQASQSPAKIEYLLPGDYEIRLAKDGYHDWQKKLSVAENGTTFAEKIMLFKNASATPLTASATVSWLVSPDKNVVIFSDKSGTISLIDINSGLLGEVSGGNLEAISKIDGAADLQLLSFSPSGRYVLAKNASGKTTAYYLIDTVLKSSKKISAALIDLKWAGDKDALYGLDKSGLRQVDLSALTAKTAIKKIAADDFFISGSSLYYLAGNKLQKTDLNGGNTTTIAALAASGTISALKNDRAFIINSDNGTTQIVDLNQKLKTITVNAEYADWLNDNSVILHSDYEIYIFETGSNYPELITRLGTKLTAVTWHPGGRHIVFSSDGKINILELDNREYRNITILNQGGADSLTLDRAGNNLYFSGQSGENTAVYKLNLQ